MVCEGLQSVTTRHTAGKLYTSFAKMIGEKQLADTWSAVHEKVN